MKRVADLARRLLALGAAMSLTVNWPTKAAEVSPSGVVWVTLGTQGGPMSSAARSQPANLLLVGPHAYVVDAGDGTVQQLAKAGVTVQAIRAVFLSHLHFDHTGGLAALLGLRLQMRTPGKLAIYGPPGTRDLVAGLTASMKPAAAAGFGIPGQPFDDPVAFVEVTELDDGQDVRLNDMTVKSRQNSHYSFPAGSDMDLRFKSFSFRFEAVGRSVVYTGDTGPSPAVEALAKGADLLVSEMIDEEATIAAVRRNAPKAPAAQVSGIVAHLTSHHLTPAEVGALARKSGVGQLVVTHIAGDEPGMEDIARYKSAIGTLYSGPSFIARDLDRF